MRWPGVLVVFVACSEPKPWPAFPHDAEAQRALVTRFTQRSTDVPAEVSWERLDGVAWATVPSGERRVAQWVRQRDPQWLLFGSFHDSRGQVEAFRRLALPAFTHVALEQLRADGRWRGVEGDQRGDSAVVAAFMKTGSREAFDALAAAHGQHDYTAWKYGYEAAVLDVAVAARAFGRAVLPCDAPHTKDERLRELHCFLSVRDAAGPGARVAMLWGMGHVGGDGFRRFIPPGERVLALHALGARWTPDPNDPVVNDLVLVPLGADDAALLLPNGRVDRVRTDADARPRVRASATAPGKLTIGSATASLDGSGEVELDVPAGEHTYVFEPASGPRFIGALEVRGETTLELDVAARETRLVLAGGAAP